MSGGDDEELAAIMREFRESLPVRIANMREQAELAQRPGTNAAEHIANLLTLAHRLRGSAGSFGLPELGEIARIIENECKIGPKWPVVLAAIDGIEERVGGQA